MAASLRDACPGHTAYMAAAMHRLWLISRVTLMPLAGTAHAASTRIDAFGTPAFGKSIFRLEQGKQADATPASIGPLLQVMAAVGTPHGHPGGSECLDAAAVLTTMLSGGAVGR
jgi:hypothetical protein